MSDSLALQQALAWARGHEAEIVARFHEFLRMPSISLEPAHRADLQRCAEWAQTELVRIGMSRCMLLSVGGPPALYAESLTAGADRLTVLLYAHYDVMPADPVDAWSSRPFDPVVRDGRLIARGALDDKCGVVVNLAALEAMLRTSQQSPINIKVLFEGEEECGSPHMPALLERYGDMLHADLLIVCDGGGLPDQPLIMTSVRGTVDAEVIVRGPQRDLHSGAYGGVVYNPLHLLGKIIAALHDADGRVLIPGFYDRVQPVGDTARAVITATEPVMQARAVADTGLQSFWAESLGSYGERATALPTCDVNGVWGGYQGSGGKTIIPAQAGFKVSMRIVPDQDPNLVMTQFTEYATGFVGAGLQVEVVKGAANWHGTLLQDGPIIELLQDSYRRVWGMPAQRYRAGGSVPLIGLIQRRLGMPVLDLGFSVGGNAHGPDEYLLIDYFARGIEMALHIYYRLAEIPRQWLAPGVNSST